MESPAFIEYFDYYSSELSCGDDFDADDLLSFPLRPAVFTDTPSSSSTSSYSASTPSTSSYNIEESGYPGLYSPTSFDGSIDWSDLSQDISPLPFELPLISGYAFLDEPTSYATGCSGRMPDVNHPSESYDSHLEPATVFLREGQLSQSPVSQDERPALYKRSRSPSLPQWTEHQGSRADPGDRRHSKKRRTCSPSVRESLHSEDDRSNANSSYLLTHATKERSASPSAPRASATVFLRDSQISQSPVVQNGQPTTCISLERFRSPSLPRWTEHQGSRPKPNDRRHSRNKRPRSPSVIESPHSEDDESDADSSYLPTHATKKRSGSSSAPRLRKRARLSEPEQTPAPAREAAPKTRQRRQEPGRRVAPRNKQVPKDQSIEYYLRNAWKYKLICPICKTQKAKRHQDLKRHIETHRAKEEYMCKGVLVCVPADGLAKPPSDSYNLNGEWRSRGCQTVFSRFDALRRHFRSPNNTCRHEPDFS